MNPQLQEVARQWTLAVQTVSAFITALGVRSFHDRDDILQNVTVAVLTRADSYDPTRPFLGWAIGIARNHVRKYFRSQGRERLAFDTDTVTALAEAFTEVALAERRRLEHLSDCVEELPEDWREICRLRFGEDLKPADIGERLDRKANTVSQTLHRIRDCLRDCVQRREEAQGDTR